MQFVVWGAIVDAAKACLIVASLVVSGLPMRPLLSWIRGAGTPSLPLSALCGLAWLSVASWYAFRWGIEVRVAFRIVLWLGAISSAALAYARFKARTGVSDLRDFGVTAAAFCATTAVYALLAHAKIRPGTLPWLTVGNNDLLVYLKAGALLLHLPHAVTQVGFTDFRTFIASDLFGAFDLIAFSAFVIHGSIENCAIPVMGVAVGLLGSAAALLCRRVYNLPWWAALTTAALLTMSPLVSYIVLQYFFGQMLFMSTLLTTSVALAQSVDGEDVGRRQAFCTVAITSIMTMFCYQPWYEQFIVLSAGAWAIASSSYLGRGFGSRVVRAALLGCLAVLMLNVVGLVSGMSRYKIAMASLSPKALAQTVGWPMHFVDFGLLVSLPIAWGSLDAPLPIVSQLVPALIIITFAGWLALHGDRDKGWRARRFISGCFCVTLALYILTYTYYGTAYRHWKFATTLALPLGITVAASIAFAILRRTSGRQRWIAASALGGVLALSMFGDVEQYFERISTPAYVFPDGIRAVAAADKDPSTSMVLIDNSSTSMTAEMAAAVFVNQKQLLFSIPTMYSSDFDPAVMPDKTVSIFGRACSSGQANEADFFLYDAPIRVFRRVPVSVGSTLSFASPEVPCLALYGFGGAESHGRWTDGHEAKIRFQCACDLRSEPVHLLLRARALITVGTGTQRAIFSINGQEVARMAITSDQQRDIVLPVPPSADGSDAIDVEIALPDAMVPSAINPYDKRALGLSVASLALLPGKVDPP